MYNKQKIQKQYAKIIKIFTSVSIEICFVWKYTVF